MVKQLLEKKEKKVEYVELIYDLIFVYIIGRNNSLLHHITGGFVDPQAFVAYLLCTVAVIQIWNFSTYYINMFGTRTDWQGYHTMYHIAWALILLNIGAQYYIELRNHDNDKYRKSITRMAIILVAEAAMVGAAVLEYDLFDSSWMSFAAIIFGMTAVFTVGQKSSADFVDFPHLSERAMLYIVFTFGEMVIAVSGYFTDEFTPNNLYFCAMAFLIVVGLFLSYGVFYDHIIDRDKSTNGLMYMLMHIFIIFALNNITNSLEFMRSEEVQLMPKLLLLICSLVMYYAFLFGTGVYAKYRCRLNAKFFIFVACCTAAFIALMLLFSQNMYVNIAVTVAYVFSMFAVIYRFGKTMDVTL